MADCNRPRCDRSRGDALLCGVKPRYVRSLNFGQSILELHTVQQSSVKNRVLVLDENVACIPSTEKEDYVRKWLETHENGDLSQSSPVLGTSATTVIRRSPILSRKRPRSKICIGRNATKRLGNADCQENVKHPANCTMRSKSHCRYKEKSVKWECMSEAQHTPPDARKAAADETSPILGTISHHVFKKKKRKLQYKLEEDSVSPKCSESHEYHRIADVNIKPMTELDDNCNNLRKMPTDRNKLEESLDTKARILVFSTEVQESLEKYQGYIETFSSPVHQERLSFADSSSNNTKKNDSKIEPSTSNDSNDEEYNKFTNTSISSSNNLSNFIEDTNTQETIETSQISMANENLISSGQPFTSLQLIIDDLNETYCSDAEVMQNQSTHLSTRISEVPSLNRTTQKTMDSKSTPTDAIISTITTPSRKSPDRTMYARLLDSGKKRRKPKKGSMVARLQSLINAQVSGIRIWRYRMNKEHATSARYISILVHDSTKRFGNQFLEGVLIEDRYDLLQSDMHIEQAEADNVQALPKEVLHKNITIMLVCDITGTLKMISEVVINVYPPWNILDKDDLTLEVMYISISNHEVPNIKTTRKSREHKKRRVLKEFNCPCIEEQRELPFCARKPSSDKPDLMQQIFNF